MEKAFAKASGKKRKKSTNLEEMRQAAEELIRRMWKARDADLKAFKRDQPAIQKLKMLPEVRLPLDSTAVHAGGPYADVNDRRAGLLVPSGGRGREKSGNAQRASPV